MSSETYESIKVEKTDQVTELLEARKIMDDDIRMVIHNAETKEEKLYQQGSDKFLAKLRVADVTFYVEYSLAGEGAYTVHTAYSHRTELGEE
ncbi:MAG: hypothetical protein AB1401_14280 [Thermodesulfobacteriota bacterium]